MSLPAEAYRVRKRSLRIAGHRTSLALEEIFWERLASIAAGRNQSLSALVATIDARRDAGSDRLSLASALRVFVLQDAISAAGPPQARDAPTTKTDRPA